MSVASMTKSTVRDRCSPEEWQARVDLAACYRLMALQGWEEIWLTHVSVRVPDGSGAFLINPFGVMFDEITASSIVKIGADRTVLEDEVGQGYNTAGFVIHGAILGAREDVQCVFHSHTVEGIAVSCQAEGLLPLQQGALRILAETAYHGYEGIALEMPERERLIANLGQANYLIMRNHGLLTVGRSAAEAFLRMYALNRACEIQIATLSSGQQLAVPDVPIREKVTRQVQTEDQLKTARMTWASLMRRLDRMDASFRN